MVDSLTRKAGALVLDEYRGVMAQAALGCGLDVEHQSNIEFSKLSICDLDLNVNRLPLNWGPAHLNGGFVHC